MHIFWKVLFLIHCLSLGACASMNWNDREDIVSIVTEKPGAEIYFKDRMQGTTPAFVKLPRARKNQIQLSYPGEEPQTFVLDSKYRWGDSFWGNAILGGLAPFGWGIDFWTGAAWNVKAGEVYSLQGKGPKEQKTTSPILIAPPVAEDETLSLEIATLVEKRMRERFPDRKWKPYVETADLFHFYQRTHEELFPLSDLAPLFYSAKSTQVLETVVQKRKGFGTHAIEASLKNAISGEVEDYYVFEVPDERLAALKLSWWERMWNSQSIWPNVLALDFSTGISSIEDINGNIHQAENRHSEGTLSQATRYLGSISLARIQQGRRTSGGRYRFSMIPALFFRWNQLNFPSEAQIRDVEFERLFLSVGYGPRFEWVSNFANVYLDIVPGLRWTSVEYDGPLASGIEQDTNIFVFTEAGISRFVSERWVISLFVRSAGEDIEVWKKALSGASDQNFALLDLRTTISGARLGYYFPEGSKKLKSSF